MGGWGRAGGARLRRVGKMEHAYGTWGTQSSERTQSPERTKRPQRTRCEV
jgi:hypothetical protein